MLENFSFSYSSANTYESCPQQFKLLYLDRVPRVNNFYSDFGSFVHLVAEKYFKGELEIWDMLSYYEDNYYEQVKTSPPSFLENSTSTYYESGRLFFENFNFDRNEYEIIITEGFLKGTEQGINFVIKPDLIFRNKSTEDVVILDFKTSEIIKKNKKTGKETTDKEKLNGYKKQMNLYIYFIHSLTGLPINKCKLWFVRSNTTYEWDYDQYEGIETLEWFISTAKKAQQETEWIANNSNQFMCNVLCSARESCKFRLIEKK